MQIELPGNLALTAPLRAVLPLQWTVNQLLTAEVIGHARENYTRLNIGGTAITARTEVPLARGQKIALRVTNVGPTIVLKVLNGPLITDASAIHRALARVLPAQNSLPETVQLLGTITTLARNATMPQPASRVPEQSASLGERVADLVSKLPLVDHLTEPKLLRRNLDQAALPTEARLNAAAVDGKRPDLNGDIRWHLTRVREQIDTLRIKPGMPPATSNRPADAKIEHRSPTLRVSQAPRAETILPSIKGAEEIIPGSDVTLTRLRQLIDGTVARLQAHQLQNLSAPGATTSLVLELPLLRGTHIDLLRFEYEADDDEHRQNDDAEPRADITISLHMDDGKEFAAQVRMIGESMNIRVGSNHAGMNALIEQRLATLRRGIEQHGFELSGLVVAPVKIDARPRVIFDHLVNDHV